MQKQLAKAAPSLRASEIWYSVQLRRLIREVNKEIYLYLTPAINEVLRIDAIDDKFFENLALMVQALLIELGMGTTVVLAGGRVEAVNFKKYDKGVYKALQINAVPSSEMSVLSEQWVKNNVALIKKATTKEVAQLETLFGEASFTGIRAKELNADIAGIFKGGRNNVSVIARDQIGKLGGKLDEFKQTNAGIEGYYWRSSLDERVRSEHALREGKYFSWAKPPEDGHPGMPIQCRCDAEPAIDRLIGDSQADAELRELNVQKRKKAVTKSRAAQRALRKRPRSR